MRRSLWSRILAGWLACWLSLVLTDGGWLHACPMHDGPAAAPIATLAVPPGATAAGMAHAAAASHGHHAAHHAAHHAGHVCGCLGACCGAAVAPALDGPALLALAPTSAARATAAPVAPVSYQPSAPEHARPPSIGPPMSRAS